MWKIRETGRYRLTGKYRAGIYCQRYSGAQWAVGAETEGGLNPGRQTIVSRISRSHNHFQPLIQFDG